MSEDDAGDATRNERIDVGVFVDASRGVEVRVTSVETSRRWKGLTRVLSQRVQGIVLARHASTRRG